MESEDEDARMRMREARLAKPKKTLTEPTLQIPPPPPWLAEPTTGWKLIYSYDFFYLSPKIIHT
jgi:hypothetical protein